MRLKCARLFDRIRCEWLLDHHQLKWIQLTKDAQITDRVSGIRIDHQRKLRKLGSHRCDRLNVPARLYLDFHALITFGDVAANAFNQLVNRFEDPDSYTRGYRTSFNAKQFTQWELVSVRVGIPQGSFNGRFGEWICWLFAQELIERCGNYL